MHYIKYKLLFILFTISMVKTQAQNNKNGAVLFDDDWKFFRGGAQRAEVATFDDSKWRTINLPHDWSIEDLPGTASPFNADAISQVSGGFTTGGTGWYRKTFRIPAEAKSKRLRLQFDGVYMNADVWINGQHLGNHPYGYTTFWYDITDKVKYGEKNVIAVEVKNEGLNSRWYSGSGIYRHVWLKTMGSVHVAQWGTYITTPHITTASAIINVKTKVVNEAGQPSSVTLITRVVNSKGVEVAKNESTRMIGSDTTYEFNGDIIIKNPELWSTENPALYTTVTEVHSGQEAIDYSTTQFGIRTISFDVVNGFRLNGKSLKLKGGCFHNDNGPLGAKAYDRAEERKVELLKQSGYNAIRCSHNPPSEAFLAACDRLGMLVMDEAWDMWKEGKNPYDYHLYFNDWWQKDIDAMVLRDRNHPSIIMWSIGNEIPERASAEGVKTAQALVHYIKSLDTTRAVTSAVNGLSEDKDPYFATLDIGGYNYAAGGDHLKKNIYELDHARVPNRIMVGTESYPLEAFGAWMDVVDHPYVIGDFVWTAWDYIGEASIGWRGYWQEKNFYPWNLAFCGDIDICGWKRPQSYYRDALWKENQLSIFVKPPQPSFEINPNREAWSKWHWLDAVADWNWKGSEKKPLEVTVYSSCPQAELFLNGKSLGKKITNRSTQCMATWQVPYTAGVLKATGYNGTKKVNMAELHTASDPVQIKLSADRSNIKSDGQDLSYITVEVLDANSIRNPKAENLIQFQVDGPGTIAGVGNANPVSLESYQQPRRKAWQGKCLVIIKSEKSSGPIILKASAEGLKSASIVINSK